MPEASPVAPSASGTAETGYLIGDEGVGSTALQAALEVAGAAEVSVSDVNAIGVGIPGTVDQLLGNVRFAVNVGIGGDEIGRIPIDPNGPLCACGQVGAMLSTVSFWVPSILARLCG